MNSQLLRGEFWANALTRALKTFAQAAVALLVGQTTGLLDIDWAGVGSVAAVAAIVSVLTSVASADQIVGPTEHVLVSEGRVQFDPEPLPSDYMDREDEPA